MKKQNYYPMEELIPIISSFFDEGKNVIITAVGNSMAPFIRNQKDGIVLTAYMGQTLKVGDMAFYKRSDGHYVLHRIVDIANDGSFTMLGDNQLTEETGIKQGQVIALPVAILRGKKTLDLQSKKYQKYSKFWAKSVFFRRVHIKLFSLKTRLLKIKH